MWNIKHLSVHLFISSVICQLVLIPKPMMGLLSFLNPFVGPVNVEPTVTRMFIPKLKEIQELKWYAGATYCPEEKLINWDCSFCINTSPDTEFIARLNDTEMETEGFIATDNQNKRIIISFRGTASDANRLTNFKIITVPFFEADEKTRVHQGFFESMDSLSDQFVSIVTEMLEDPFYINHRIVLVGHSLGGAMAALAAIRLQDDLNLPWSRFQVFTYGQPRTGNIAFAQWFNRRPISLARVVTHTDIVPHLLGGSLGYFSHHQNEVFIDLSGGRPKVISCDAEILEDPTCSNKFLNDEYSSKLHNVYWDMDISDPC